MISIDLNPEMKKHLGDNKWWHHQSYAVTQGKVWRCEVTVGPFPVTWREAVLEVRCGAYLSVLCSVEDMT